MLVITEMIMAVLIVADERIPGDWKFRLTVEIVGLVVSYIPE